MELLVQYRNKLKAAVWLIILAIAGYFFIQPKVIPSVWVNNADKDLTHLDGYLYYRNKAFSGYLYRDYANGNRERETPYYEGKEEGLMKSWYADKKPEQERLFVNGKKQGTHRGWWPNGKPKFEYQFKDDEHNGTAKEWFNDDKLYRIFHYVNGHEEGLQQMWWADGKVRANYVVKNGQQYGLIGRKFCKNVSKQNEIKKTNSVYAAVYSLP